MQKFTITASKNGIHEEITVLAKAHRQHIHTKTTLIGVTKTGCKRLDDFFKNHDGWNIYIASIPTSPKLIGYEL